MIRKGSRPALEVVVVKGCPLIHRDVGRKLLQEYEVFRASGKPTVKSVFVPEGGSEITKDPRAWLSRQVSKGGLSRQAQMEWLHAMFPRRHMN